MKFPRFRVGYDHSSEKKARQLDDVDVPYLRSRTPGAVARKKDGFLEVITSGSVPYLWALVTLKEGEQFRDNPLNMRVPSKADQLVSSSKYEHIEVNGEASSEASTQCFVGGNYVLRWNVTSVGGGTVWWPSLVCIGSKKAEVLSLSADNKKGANVSFSDVVQLGVHDGLGYGFRASMCATGWDEDLEAYRFVVFGTPFGEYLAYSDNLGLKTNLVCYVGDTKTRRMTAVPIPSADDSQYSFSSMVNCVGRGKLFMLAAPRKPLESDPLITRGMQYPEPPVMLRSADHGQTWTVTDATWLQPYLLYTSEVVAGETVERYARVLSDGTPQTHGCIFMPQCAVASPVGEGRIACVALCTAGAVNTPVTGGADITDAAFRLFISDENGENFQNVPWPPDAWIGPTSKKPAFLGGRTPTPQVSVATSSTLLGNSPVSAGPGSLFFSTYEFDAGAASGQVLRVLSTKDYGATWVLSDPLDVDMINDRFQTSMINDNLAIVTFAVARAVSETSKGEILLMAVRDGVITTYRTTDYFETFKLASKTKVKDLERAPISGIRIHPVYVGAIGSDYPPLINPGYRKEFEPEA
ncbi:hypothetical protein [Polaromonas sp.]|uniref:hypothetical protein n=1 Tax=Polaromonas sp. TaxID=1869339 RepID=UPI003262CDC3